MLITMLLEQLLKQWLQLWEVLSLYTLIALMKHWLYQQPSQQELPKNTQLILSEETGITNVVDPLAGSFYLENLTSNMVDEAKKLIKEIDEVGGMVKAIEMGIPKMRIEESSAKRHSVGRLWGTNYC